MNIRKPSKALVLIFALLGMLAGGCKSRQDRAREASSEYQAAMAKGDLLGARRALLELVTADDSVADYWIELGKVQLQLSDFGAAYNSFSRARELDRANPLVLAVLTQLTLRAGNFHLAEQIARELELVAPEDPAVRLTYGYAALRQGKLDEASKQASLMLAASPLDPSAKVLQARVLIMSGKQEEAIGLLRDQVQRKPSDEMGLAALYSIYQLQGQWPEAAWAARRLVKNQPKNQRARGQLIESELRAGQISAARSDTVTGLASAKPQEIELLLTPWFAAGAQAQIADAVFKLGQAASGDRRIALARFLVQTGQYRQAAELTQGDAKLPVTASNTAANALYGTALAQTGQSSEGLDRLNKVITLDSANADALRGRAEYSSRTGNYQLAIEDAQKLIATDRRSWQARLLLASIYAAASDPDHVRQTLWEAFHDIPTDRSIYGALRKLVLASEGEEAARRLDEEFNDKRTAQIIQGFV